MVRGLAGSAAILSGGLLVAPQAAAAYPDPTYDACMARVGRGAYAQDCERAGRVDVERRLAAAYARTLGAMAPDQRAALRASERLWVHFRETDCGVFHSGDVGSEAIVAAGDCIIDRAEQRILNLKGFMP